MVTRRDERAVDDVERLVRDFDVERDSGETRLEYLVDEGINCVV